MVTLGGIHLVVVARVDFGIELLLRRAEAPLTVSYLLSRIDPCSITLRDPFWVTCC